MSTGLLIALTYGTMFAVLCGLAMAQRTTVWRILGDSFIEIFKGFSTACAAVGLAERPTAQQPRRSSSARIRQLERELGIGPQPRPPTPCADGNHDWVEITTFQQSHGLTICSRCDVDRDDDLLRRLDELNARSARPGDPELAALDHDLAERRRGGYPPLTATRSSTDTPLNPQRPLDV